ncbi:hypothetical protein DL765_006196 [Monosporascus sp. GIB2]|nr:hypothetical protein DL765_006196 [Monosporascus sp. GIB2]
MSPYPVCCTAEVPTEVVERFLNDAHAGAERLVPNTPRCLAVVTSVDGTASIPTTASEPPLQPFTSPFIGQSAEEVYNHVNGANYLAILDQQSIEDGTAVLVARRPGGIQTVRTTFESAQHLLTGLEIATLGFDEIQQVAGSSGGVYGASRNEPQRGGPAPRRRLGGN